jgi:hypothetical protein
MPGSITLLAKTLAGAVTAELHGPVGVDARPSSLVLYVKFVRAAGGTTAKAWVQTTVDGTNWFDIACFSYTTTDAQRMCTLTDVAVTTIATPADGTTADNTVVNGFLGSAFRVKLTTTGTYSGASSFTITALPKA